MKRKITDSISQNLTDSDLESAICHTEKNSSVKFIELFKIWDTGIYGTEFCQIYRTFQYKMQKIQEKLLKVPY